MLTVQLIKALTESASTAVSSHNTQPWLFRAGTRELNLWADRTRALPVNDPLDRELIMSCGAALLSLRVAAAANGLGIRTELLPKGADCDHLARVVFADGPVEEELAALDPVLKQRRTFRQGFAEQPVAAEAMRDVEQAVAAEGAVLLALDGERRQRAAELVAEGDRVQWADRRWRAELAKWMRAPRSGDGLPVPALMAPTARAVVRAFNLGRVVAEKDQRLANAAPWLTVLATDADAVVDWIRAGQALQRALLVGCRMGLQASYFNQPIEVPSLRPRLQALTGSPAHPQLLIRWGHPPKALPPSPRRPVDSIFDVQNA